MMPSLHELVARASSMLEDFGAVPPEGGFICDGSTRRCGSVEDGSGSTSISYRVHLESDGIHPPLVWAYSYRNGERLSRSLLSHAETEAPVPPDAAEMERARREKADKERREAELERVASASARWIWAHSAPCSGHPYLERKRVRPCPGLRTYKGALLLPLSLPGGEVDNVQFIRADGTKRFKAGAPKRGRCFLIEGTARDASGGGLRIVEGLATGLSVWEVTGADVLVALDAYNLAAVAEKARQAWPERPFCFCADNDCTDGDGNPRAFNVGVEMARDAAGRFGGTVTIPPAVHGKKADWNDYHVFCMKEGGADGY